MKILIHPDSPRWLNLDASPLRAEPATCPETGRLLWRVWCEHCRAHHWHGPGEGHRLAHCHDPTSPFQATGYNLTLAD